QGALCGNVKFATGKFRNTEHAILVSPNIEINSRWLFELLNLEKLNRFRSGAAQPGLAVKTLNEIIVPVADLNSQNEYANFVQQVDKSKVVIQKSLDETQKLYDSLMQEYFG
ncbi:restriction endonuclease subunit S, partial [Limosilactobacillus reuteri]